jgi:hypothetical protein
VMRRWTEAELDVLATADDVRTAMKDLPDRSYTACRTKALRSGIRFESSFNPWSSEETAIVMSVRSTTDIPEVMAALPGRSYSACFERLRRLNVPLVKRGRGIRDFLLERKSWWDAAGRRDRVMELVTNHTHSQIAGILGTTKNAVSGVVWKIRQESWEPPPPRVYVFEKVRARECCWPIGDPDDSAFHFCGDEALIGRSYCVEHLRTAYRVIDGKNVA